MIFSGSVILSKAKELSASSECIQILHCVQNDTAFLSHYSYKQR